MQGRIYLVLAAQLAASAFAAAPVPVDSFAFVEVARVQDFYPSRYVVCGDADRDGRQELYAERRFVPRFAYALEFAADLTYDTVRYGAEYLVPLATGNFDQDSRPDLLAWDAFPVIYECPDSGSLSLPEVWADSTGLGSFLPAAADLDMDSAVNFAWTFPYECDGDNRYSRRPDMPTEVGGCRSYCAGPDVDGDGKPEFVIGEYTLPRVALAEAVGDDTFTVSAVCSLPAPTSAWVTAVRGAPDLDRDGRPEVLALAVSWDGMGTLVAIESPGPDSFAVVWSAGFPAARHGNQAIVTGDVDGDSLEEFAVATGTRVRVFRCAGPDRYEQFWDAYTGKSEVGLHDLDCDGRAELIYRYGDQTVICKYMPVGIEDQVRRGLEQAIPTIVRGVLRLTADSRQLAASGLELLDVTGRAVLTRPPDRSTAGPLSLDVSRLSPGAYFIRVSSAGQSVTRKLLILP